MDYNEILEKALAEGKRRHPSAPVQHHAAFANSVTYLVTGASGGYGGPSVREHTVSHSALLQGGGQQTVTAGINSFIPSKDTVMPGNWKYEQAIVFADPLVFGKLTDLHFQCYRTEACFDDAPEDIKALKKWQAGSVNP